MSDTESRRMKMLGLELEVPCLDTLILIQRILDSEDEDQKEARRKIFKTESFELKVASLDLKNLTERIPEVGDEIDNEHFNTVSGDELDDEQVQKETETDEKLECVDEIMLECGDELDNERVQKVNVRKKESFKLESFIDRKIETESLNDEEEIESWTDRKMERMFERGDLLDDEQVQKENDRKKEEKLESLLDRQSQKEIDRKKESLNEEKKLESLEDEIKKNESLKKENQKEVAETQSWTQKVPERKMFDDETRRLAMEEKEKELEMLEKQIEEREKEIETEKKKNDEEKAAKEAKKKEKRKNLRKLKKKLEEALEGAEDSGTLVEEVIPTSPESGNKKRKKGDKKKKVRKLPYSECGEERNRDGESLERSLNKDEKENDTDDTEVAAMAIDAKEVDATEVSATEVEEGLNDETKIEEKNGDRCRAVWNLPEEDPTESIKTKVEQELFGCTLPLQDKNLEVVSQADVGAIALREEVLDVESDENRNRNFKDDEDTEGYTKVCGDVMRYYEDESHLTDKLDARMPLLESYSANEENEADHIILVSPVGENGRHVLNSVPEETPNST